MNKHRTLKILVAALLGATWAQAQAAEPNWDNWNCKWCPFPESGTTGSASAEALNVSDDSAKFGDYTGLNDSGAYINADADLQYRGEGGYGAEVKARDLGLDSREIAIEAGHQGSWMVDLSYNAIPRYLDDTSSTVFSGAGTSRLSLPSGWVRAGNTAGMSALDASLRPLDIDYDVKTFGLGLEFVQSKRLRYTADWTRQTKEGHSETWGNFFGTAASLSRPIDYQTDQVDAAVIYSGDGWMVKGAYYGSFFSNKDLFLTWDNPFTGPDRGRMANAPDNQYNQFLLSGTFGLDFWDTRVNASYAAGTMEQSDALVGYTVNSSIASAALPRSSFDGKVDTTHANLRAVARPMAKLRLVGEYRLDERDNKSSRDTWDIVQADSFVSFPAENPLYGYKRTDYGISGDYAFNRMVQAYAGWERTKKDRDEQEVANTEEDLFWAKLKLRPSANVALSLKAEDAQRDASAYRQAITGAGQADNPLMRKYYMADRDRNAYTARVEFSGERGSVSLRYENANDDYKHSPVGLTGTDYNQVALDGSLVLFKGLVGSAFYSRENYDSDLVGAGSATAPNTAPRNWNATTKDRQEMVGLALDWPGLVDERFDVRADWTWVDTTSDIGVSKTLGGTKDPFPTLRGKLNGGTLKGTFHYSPKVDFILGYRYEKYDSSDWALEGVGPGTIASVLTFGSQPLDYEVNLVSLAFEYKFGVKPPEEE